MERLSRTKTIAYSIGNLAAGMYYAFNNFILGPYLRLFTQNNILIGWLTSTRSFEQSIVQPAVGAWSDRTWTRLGRRAPFFLAGMSLSAMLLIANGLIPPDAAWLLTVVIAIFLFSFFFNVGIDPYVALLADVTPSEQRASVNGIAGIFGAVGSILILIAAVVLFEINQALLFMLVAAALVLGFATVALVVHEPREQIGPHAHTSRRSLAGLFFKSQRRAMSIFMTYLANLHREQREATKLLGVRFLYQFGINAAAPFIVFFVTDEIGTRGVPEMAASFPALSLLGLDKLDAQAVAFMIAADFIVMSGLWTVVCGFLADRYGKKRIFALGLFMFGTSALFAAFATTIPQLLFYLVLIGFGNGAQTVLFFPYLSDLIPLARVGEFQGLSATAETGGYFLSILLAGELLNLNLFNLHYRLIFIITGIFLLLAVFAVMFVKAKLDASGETTLEVALK